MDKKVTIKDVAMAAGVSKATVSYVLNNREDQSISEATKKKVWQVVNMLNYRPNSFAQNMRVSQEKKIIAVFFPNHPTILEKLSYFDILEELKQEFRDSNYEILLLNNTTERVNTADAIIACGLTKQEFFALGDCNLIPLISINCKVDDPLFFEVSYDFQKLKEVADTHFSTPYTFVDITPRDKNIQNTIKSIFPDALFVDCLSELLNISVQNILVTRKSLQALLSEKYSCDIYCPEYLQSAKAIQVVQCIKLALEHKPCSQHIFKI